MNDDTKYDRRQAREERKQERWVERQERRELRRNMPLPWKNIQAAIWLFGLAILFWRGWMWPGILFLVAISGFVEAIIIARLQAQQKAEDEVIQAQTVEQTRIDQEQVLQQERAAWIPATCPQCGAPLGLSTIQWTGPATGNCPYCAAHLSKP
jgi:hypothetical protein